MAKFRVAGADAYREFFLEQHNAEERIYLKIRRVGDDEGSCNIIADFSPRRGWSFWSLDHTYAEHLPTDKDDRCKHGTY